MPSEASVRFAATTTQMASTTFQRDAMIIFARDVSTHYAGPSTEPLPIHTIIKTHEIHTRTIEQLLHSRCFQKIRCSSTFQYKRHIMLPQCKGDPGNVSPNTINVNIWYRYASSNYFVTRDVVHKTLQNMVSCNVSLLSKLYIPKSGCKSEFDARAADPAFTAADVRDVLAFFAHSKRS